MHWTERRRAKVNLALGLQTSGWTLYGFKEDRSDSMTDYYDPASWDGIAEKDGANGTFVVVVDVKPSNEAIHKRSGGYETTKRVPGDDCIHCQGAGKEPSAELLPKEKAVSTYKSIVAKIASETRPAGTLPGHRTMQGTR